MTDPSVKECLDDMDRYLEASYDSSEELRLMAIRAAISSLAGAIQIIWRELEFQSSAPKVNESG